MMRIFSSGATLARRTGSSGAIGSKGRVLALVVVVVALAAPASALGAGNAGSTTVYSEPIAFTLDAGVCPALPEELSIDFTGTVHGHIHVSTDANGVVHVSWPDTITGTAVDSEGNTYRFNYTNVLIVRDAGLPIEVTITDHFNLVGNGAANQLHTFFVLRLLITAEGEEEIVFSTHGDPGPCDAI
jgi:hypothetical protein